jgi:hypothetical protein
MHAVYLFMTKSLCLLKHNSAHRVSYKALIGAVHRCPVPLVYAGRGVLHLWATVEDYSHKLHIVHIRSF